MLWVWLNVYWTPCCYFIDLQVASDPRVSFFGNVCLGQDISAAQISELYDVVVLAYGAAGDRELTVPGADLEGVFAARAFVSW